MENKRNLFASIFAGLCFALVAFPFWLSDKFTYIVKAHPVYTSKFETLAYPCTTILLLIFLWGSYDIGYRIYNNFIHKQEDE